MIVRHKTSLKRTPLKKVGPKARAWKEFRDAKFSRDKDEDGFIKCQCYMVLGGFPCGRYARNPDLHHLIERSVAPERYFDEANLIWVTRECHDKL